MKKVRLITSKLNVEIEPEMIVLYTVEGDDSEGAVIPLSYCSIVDIDDGTYPDDGITFTLGLKRAGKRAYLEKQTSANRHIRFPSDRNIRFEGCFHKTVGKIISCRFTDDYLARAMMRFLLAVKTINYEYLELHGDNIVAIKEVSTTVRFTEKAKKIIGKIVAETDEPCPRF